MAPNRRSRYSGTPRAVKFEQHMMPRLKSGSGACNIQVPALRESEVINLAFVERLELGAENEGMISDQAGPERYSEFLEMSRFQMANLVRRLLADFADCFTEPARRGEANLYYTLCATFDTLLYLVARGNILFSEESGIAFCKPECGSPPPTMQRRILARLRADRPIHFMVLEIETGLDVPDPDRGKAKSVPSPASTSKPRTLHYPNEGFALDIHRDHLVVRATDYHTDDLVLFWEELFDLAKGLGLDLPRGAPS